jgi:hypothetical protein
LGIELKGLFHLGLAALAGTAMASAGAGEASLCAPGENIVFSCHVGPKTVSLCRPAGTPQALVYRFGAPGRLELVFPEGGRAGSAGFARADALRYGGGSTAVSFRRGEYQYSLYSQLGRSEGPDRTPEFEDGLLVSRNGKLLKRFVCDDGGEGFRESVDWLPLEK